MNIIKDKKYGCHMKYKRDFIYIIDVHMQRS